MLTGGGSGVFIPMPAPVDAPDGQAGCGADAGALPVYVLRLLGSTLLVDVGEEATPENDAGVGDVVGKRLSGAFVANPLAGAEGAVWLPIGFREAVDV